MSKIIGINGFFLNKPYTGIYRYTYNALKSLARVDTKNTYIIVSPQNVDIRLPKNFKIVQVPFAKIPTKSLKKWYFEQVTIAKQFRKHNVTTAWYPYPSNSVLVKNVRTVVTVHDTIPWENAQYRKKWRTRAYQNFVQRNLKFVDDIIAVSKSTAHDLKKTIAPEKIHVIPNVFFDHQIKTSFPPKGKICKKYKITKKYILYVGGYDTRKNVGKLVRAFMRANKKAEFELVLVGGALHNDELYKSAKLKGVHVVKTDFVSDDDMHALYHYANGFAHFSEAEGFNLPVLYGALHKIPLILSNISVHTEVVGEKGALFVPVHNTPRQTKVLEGFLKKTKKEYAEMVKRAHESVQKFHEKHHAEALKALLEKEHLA